MLIIKKSPEVIANTLSASYYYAIQNASPILHNGQMDLPERKERYKADPAIGRRVADARIKTGLTQEQAAALLSERYPLTPIDASSLSLMERGKRAISLIRLLQFRDVYDVDVRELIEGTPPDEQEKQAAAALARRLNKVPLSRRRAAIRAVENVVDAFLAEDDNA